MSREKCPRCGLKTYAVETIKAQRMPDVKGNRVHDLVGHVYYHTSGAVCAVPRIGEAYATCPDPETESPPGPLLDRDARGTGPWW